ncbi:Probable licABCH operon regulator [Listeria grayi]|uniref:PRD domain-containing protein n=1 Tax=Listeria grayi FSL F6-1183 TaxID=1265827 RepID=A0A829R9G4_LISGR|nr:PRD domain-containing protein [Listeria grayi]EUJ30374.1 PRD domain-containing protein [Listeria grayi FSL F6-1183]VEI31062.1 Probable licABCH operon regulator [Listeria grayi]
MIFSSKENLLLNHLNFEEFVSAKYLSKELYVSSKTIYRIVKRINEISLKDYHVPLVDSEAGKGYKLNNFFLNKDIYSVVPIKEENDLFDEVLTLLFKHPKKTVRRSLPNYEYLSESSRVRKMKKIGAIVSRFELNLHYDQDFIWLSGKETNIRKAINSLLLEINKNNSLGEINVEINNLDKYFIDSQIALIEEKIGEYINYPYDVALYTHIFMLIKRYRDGKVRYLESQEPLENDERLLMEANSDIKEVAEKIVKNVTEYVGVALNELETYFLFQNVYSINIQKRESSHIDKKLAEEITTTYITRFFGISDISLLPSQRSLYEDLYQHVLPMLSRLRLGIGIENNMLDEVISEYRDTYLKVKAASNEINKELAFEKKINNAETGYITLYFEKYKIKQKEQKNLLLICSTGVGTSELLKIRVQQRFPDLNIVATMSQRQARKNLDFINENIDLIFSTIRVPMQIGKIPVLNIGPLLTEKDIQTINYFFKEMN